MPDLIPAPRPVESPEERMRHATTPGPTFATYLDRHDRDQLDARAACAEAERDDALDDRDQARRERDDYARSRNHFADLLQATATALHMPGGAPIDDLPAKAARLHAELDEMREARDVLRHQLDHYRAVTKRLGNQAAEADGWERIATTVEQERDRLVETIGRLVSLPPEQIAEMHKVGYSASPADLGSPADRAQDETEAPAPGGGKVGYEVVARALHRDGLGALVSGDVVASAVSTRPTLAEAVAELWHAVAPAEKAEG